MAINEGITAEKLGYLRDSTIFQDLATDEIDTLGKRTPMQWMEAGTIFYSPEQSAQVLFILKKGRVRIYRMSEEGKVLTIAMLEAGTIFGEMAILGQQLHEGYAEAVSRCLLCMMSREDVKTLLLSDPRVAFRVAEVMGQRLIATERRLSDFAFKSLSQRLAGLLLQLQQPPRKRLFRGDAPMEVPYTHEILAEMVGTHRETITKILNVFQDQQLIELRRGRVLILDSDGLQQRSGG
ncbi:MAG: Crp/Fnr family transcriptional regulator [Chloroflexaceae bacterium]|nr:Crp/Fnr family transcriptional regulator [Chloroflexaceae bacterium]